jgi:hypothetical protein
MKTLFSIAILFFVFSTHIQAQQTYTIDGTQYTLNTEVEGPLTLLWNTINSEYLYFVKKGDEIVALKNTKVDGKYQEEYKQTLSKFTGDGLSSTSKVKLTLSSLKSFFIDYNKQVDPNFKVEENSIKLKTRLGAFAGITNIIYTDNPTNALQPVVGIDFEVFEENNLRRHSMVLRFKQTLESSDHKYSASQVSFNYRFKFIKKDKIDVFINTKFAAYTYSKVLNLISGTTSSSGSFRALGLFGLGMDYALANGYLTFNYNDIVGFGPSSNGEFPVDFTVGYKFNL